MSASRNPVKASAIREGFTTAEAFFASRGIAPARARELAGRCVSNYRRIAGAGSYAISRSNPATTVGAKIRRNPADAFSAETLSNMLRGEGVL